MPPTLSFFFLFSVPFSRNPSTCFGPREKRLLTLEPYLQLYFMFLMQYRAIQSIIRHNRTRDPDFTCRDHGHTGHSGPRSMGNSANSAPKYRKKTSNGLNKHHGNSNYKTQHQTDEGSTSDSSSTGLSGVRTLPSLRQPPCHRSLSSCLQCTPAQPAATFNFRLDPDTMYNCQTGVDCGRSPCLPAFRVFAQLWDVWLPLPLLRS